MKNMCESCGMPLKKDENKGTLKNGTLSSKYCRHCFADGEFIHPDATVEEMREHSIKGMNQNGMPKFLAKIMTSRISSLPRW